ncbi:MAG: LysR family transcriptional regulator [Pseudomonadota bacterium]
MKLSDFDLFLEIARRGSFARVAEDRGVDPSSVSRQIAGLEQQLGYRLFERTTRRLSLTEAGRATFERIQVPLEEIGQICSQAKDMVGFASGVLRVTASVAFAERWLIPRLKTFQKRHEAIRLDLVLTDANVDIAAENIDVAIRLGQRMAGSYVATRLMPTRYHVVASPGFIERYGQPTTPTQLQEFNCITFSLPGYQPLWRFRGADEKTMDVPVSGKLSATNALALRRAAIEGIGIALLGDWTIDADLRAGRLLDVFPAWRASASGFDTAAWILYPSRSYMPAKTRAFIDFLKSV